MRVDTKYEMKLAIEKFGRSDEYDPGKGLPISIISVNDDMFHSDASSYFRIGIQAVEIISPYLVGKSSPRILVLPSGHGRETRFFKHCYPKSELIACDLEEDAIEFCEKVFGCTPLLSDEDFSKVDFPKNCDLIWMGSLITHISESRTRDLIRILLGCLKKGGTLIFTSHGNFVSEILSEGPNYGIDAEGTDKLNKDFRNHGYGYSDYPGQVHYGISVISPKWFKQFILSLEGEMDFDIKEKHWDNHHDVVSITIY